MTPKWYHQQIDLSKFDSDNPIQFSVFSNEISRAEVPPNPQNDVMVETIVTVEHKTTYLSTKDIVKDLNKQFENVLQFSSSSEHALDITRAPDWPSWVMTTSGVKSPTELFDRFGYRCISAPNKYRTMLAKAPNMTEANNYAIFLQKEDFPDIDQPLGFDFDPLCAFNTIIIWKL